MDELELEGLEGLTEIGRGGFGVVYRAVETDLNRTVAVKLLNTASAEVLQRRLDRERRAMGVLSGHPNIVTIHRTGMAAGSPYLVLEFLGGGSLADRLATSGPVPWREAVDIGIAMADAVEAAHRAGVLHRDIKPGNILLSSTGVPKLGDFGIANVESVSQTSGVLKATVAHAPPEVLAGQEPDARSDVYSLASTIYELIAGRPAFVRPTDTSPVPVLMRITSEPVPDLDPGLAPGAVSRCLQQAMAKDRDHRPATAATFGSLLQASADGAGEGSGHAVTQLAPHYAPPPLSQPPTASPPTAAPPPAPPPVANPPASANPLAAAPPPVTQPPAAGWVQQGPSGHPPAAAPASPGGGGRGAVWLAVGGFVAAIILIFAVLVVLSDDDDDPPVADADRVETLSDTQPTQAPEPSTVDTAPSTVEDTTPPAPALDTVSVAGRIDALERLVAGDLAADPAYGTLPDYPNYNTYSDGAGVIVVSIPAEWDDRVDATSEGAPGIQVGTSIAGAFAGQPESGVSVFLYPPGSLPSAEVDPLLDLLIEVNELNCVERPSVAFDHRLFSGRYQVLSACVDSDPDLLGMQMIGPLKDDNGYFLQVTVIASSAADIAAASEVFETLQILLARLG